MRMSDWSSDVCSSDLDYRANQAHPLFPELHSMVKKALGMDHILESILSRLGNLERALLLDDYAEGKDSGIIDLCLIGDIERNSLRDLTEKSERYLNGKVRTLELTKDEYTDMRERLEEQTSELQSLMRNANAVFGLKTQRNR